MLRLTFFAVILVLGCGCTDNQDDDEFGKLGGNETGDGPSAEGGDDGQIDVNEGTDDADDAEDAEEEPPNEGGDEGGPGSANGDEGASDFEPGADGADLGEDERAAGDGENGQGEDGELGDEEGQEGEEGEGEGEAGCVPAEEVCDGQDDDCDGIVDEGPPDDATTWFVDADGDGFGDSDEPTVTVCDAPQGHADRGGDCDDEDEWTFPGAPELCDGRRNDCDGRRNDCDDGDWEADLAVASFEGPDGWVDVTAGLIPEDGEAANHFEVPGDGTLHLCPAVWRTQGRGRGGDPHRLSVPGKSINGVRGRTLRLQQPSDRR